MKKEILLVPRKKHPMDNLIDLVKKSPNSWVFLHANMREALEKGTSTVASNRSEFHWKAKNDGRRYLYFAGIHPWIGTWASVTIIQSEDVDYTKPSDPEDIYFLKMEE